MVDTLPQTIRDPGAVPRTPTPPPRTGLEDSDEERSSKGLDDGEHSGGTGTPTLSPPRVSPSVSSGTTNNLYILFL